MVRQMNFNEELKAEVKKAEEVLNEYMPEKTGLQSDIMEAMNYSVKAGGKRLRPVILSQCFCLYGSRTEICKPFMAALEMIHNYSLVHDDLPCMDNDRLRRGMDTTWVKYGECMAVLTGDALLNYAFETAAKAFDYCESVEDYKAVSKALRYLMEKAGIYGMIGGQVVDTESEKKSEPIEADVLEFIHEKKTGALLEAAFVCGAALGGASDAELEKLSKIALGVGVAFQIRDDILDIEGDEALLGKPIGSDIENEKQTYVSIHGMEKAKEDVEKLSEEAILLLKSLNKNTEFLEELIKYLVGRDK